MNIKRGEIYYADLSPVVGSEQGGIRPVLIIQNDIGNRYSPTVIAAAVTSQLNKSKLPTHIEIDALTYGLPKDSVILTEQIRTIDKRRLKERIGELNKSTMDLVDNALLLSLEFSSAVINICPFQVSLINHSLQIVSRRLVRLFYCRCNLFQIPFPTVYHNGKVTSDILGIVFHFC